MMKEHKKNSRKISCSCLLLCLSALLLWHCAEVPEYGKLTVNVSPYNAGVVYQDQGGSEYEKGTVVQLTAASSSSDYTFTHWSGDMQDSSSTIYFEMNGNKTLTANFARQYTLTVLVSGGPNNDIQVNGEMLTIQATGAVSQSSNLSQQNAIRYISGTQVTVIARSMLGYAFKNWSGASTSTDTTIKITLNDNTTLTANYVLVPTTPPSSVTATAKSSNSIDIVWTKAENAAGYYIYRSASATGPFEQVAQTAADTSYTNTGVSSGTMYYYKVAAHGNGVTTAQSSSFAYTTTPPGTPYGVTAEAISSNSITVSWPAVSGTVSGYYIYRSESLSGEFAQVGVVGSSITTYTSVGLSPGVTYYYKVAAYGTGGTGAQSSAVSAATHLNAAPAGVAAIANTSSSITISWSSVTGADGYNIYRSLGSSGNFDLIKETTASSTSYTDDGLYPGAAYNYKIAAFNGSGEGPLSSAVSSAVPPSAAPTDLIATSNSSNSITVSWGSIAGASGYYVYRTTNYSDPFELIYTTGTSPSYTDTGLLPNTQYFYKIAAYNNGGTGPQSSTFYATTGSSE